MDPSLNYATVLGVAPKESSRQLVAYQPSNGGPYVSDSNQIVSIDIPATAYLNPDASYVKFKYQASYVRNTVSGAHTNSTTMNVVLDGGATSCFSRATLINGNGGAVISETTDFAEVAQHLIRNKGEDFAKSIGVNAMGWHPCFVSDDGANETSATNSIQNTATSGFLPGKFQRVITAGATEAAGVTATGEDAVFAIPLSFFSGLFAQDMALPLKHMGTANALRLDLTVNSAARALYVCAQNAFTDADWDTSKVSYKFTLSEVELMSSLSNVGEAIDMNVKNMIDSSGIHIKYTDVTARLDTNWSAGQTEYQMTTNKPALSLDKITVQLRDSSKVNSILAPSVTGFRRFTLKSLQSQIGSVFYPSAPLRLSSTNFNGSAYLETAQVTDGDSGLESKAHVYAPSYNGVSTAGFELGFNLGARKDSYQFNGRDTRTGSSAVTLRLEKTETATPLATLVIFEATWPLLVDKSGVIPAARG